MARFAVNATFHATQHCKRITFRRGTSAEKEINTPRKSDSHINNDSETVADTVRVFSACTDLFASSMHTSARMHEWFEVDVPSKWFGVEVPW